LGIDVLSELFYLFQISFCLLWQNRYKVTGLEGRCL